MLFLTLFFIFATAYGLLKGKLFYSLLVELAENEVKKARGEINELPKELTTKVGLMVLYMLVVLIVQFTYIVKSLSIDPNLYPTAAILIHIFTVFVVSIGKKGKDLATELGRSKYLAKVSKKYSVNGFFSKIAYLTYFIYMFAVLTDIIK
ncbi:hypothetical protein [Bacillus sp. T33-2]|uniref:hypothetical protein n=1 Tax=Bacillus sp. T33-2 TaxID=2054168 RepID=UPI000C7605AA|nr:hypothetical protein [Bacillus sp. T33-2]PLR99511.1 hypothetical protein CVD19_00175 [Bacillus sp. T33-2]